MTYFKLFMVSVTCDLRYFKLSMVSVTYFKLFIHVLELLVFVAVTLREFIDADVMFLHFFQHLQIKYNT